jgi:hypothetical protein
VNVFSKRLAWALSKHEDIKQRKGARERATHPDAHT